MRIGLCRPGVNRVELFVVKVRLGDAGTQVASVHGVVMPLRCCYVRENNAHNCFEELGVHYQKLRMADVEMTSLSERSSVFVNADCGNSFAGSRKIEVSRYRAEAYVL